MTIHTAPPLGIEGRLVALERDIKNMQDSIVLAREQIKDERENTKRDLNHRLEGYNNATLRIEKMESTFATKEEVTYITKEVARTERLVYIGVGGVLAIELLLRFVK